MSKPVIELTKKGTDEVVATACGKCGFVAPNRELSESCCEPHVCERGEVSPYPYTRCRPCMDKRASAQEAKRFEAAKKTSWRDYDGPVYHEGIGGDGYFISLDELDGLDGDERPAYVWSCTRFGLTLNAEDIVNNAIESQEHHEDAFDSVDGLDDLQAKLDAWLAKQTLESWMVDYSEAVVLDGFFEDEA